jgi:hypothetical protein
MDLERATSCISAKEKEFHISHGKIKNEAGFASNYSGKTQ